MSRRDQWIAVGAGLFAFVAATVLLLPEKGERDWQAVPVIHPDGGEPRPTLQGTQTAPSSLSTSRSGSSGSLRVIVTNDAGGGTVPGAQVRLVRGPIAAGIRILQPERILAALMADESGTAVLSLPEDNRAGGTLVAVAWADGFVQSLQPVPIHVREVLLTLKPLGTVEIRGSVRRFDGSACPGATVFARPTEWSEALASSGALPLRSENCTRRLADERGNFVLSVAPGAYFVRAGTPSAIAYNHSGLEQGNGEILVAAGAHDVVLIVAPAGLVRARFVHESGAVLRRPFVLSPVTGPGDVGVIVRDGLALTSSGWTPGHSPEGFGDVQRVVVAHRGTLPPSLKFFVTAAGLPEFACTLKVHPLPLDADEFAAEVVRVPTGGRTGRVAIRWIPLDSPLTDLMSRNNIFLVLASNGMAPPISIASSGVKPSLDQAEFEAVPTGSHDAYVQFPGVASKKVTLTVRPEELTHVDIGSLERPEGLLIRVLDDGGNPLDEIKVLASAEKIRGESVTFSIDGSPPTRTAISSVPIMRFPTKRVGSGLLGAESSKGLRHYCSLPPGRWSVSIVHEGFEPLVREIERRPGDLLELEVEMLTVGTGK